ncbi:MAG: hypothetical protein RLY21_1583 [Planctomycetota bacterium]
MKIASTTPPRESIHGRSARVETFPIELEPPSNKTSDSPDSTATAVPSPIANIVHSKCGWRARGSPRRPPHMTIATTISHPTTRVLLRLAQSATQLATARHPAMLQWTPPSAIEPAPHRIESSTSST